MPNAIIDSLIDNDKPYAYAYIEQGNPGYYGHMHLDIRLGRAGSNLGGKIAVSCQIGSDSGYEPQFAKTYAWRHGFVHSGYDAMTLAELEQGVKAMRKVEKGFERLVAQGGYPVCFAEYCLYVLDAAGSLPLIAEPEDGWVNGGLMTDKELLTNSIHARKKLYRMEEALINRFAMRKAA